eukprot:COSAG02_NODE_9195_length_2292_cov_37.516644_2_plen_86_part_00
MLKFMPPIMLFFSCHYAANYALKFAKMGKCVLMRKFQEVSGTCVIPACIMPEFPRASRVARRLGLPLGADLHTKELNTSIYITTC